MLAVLNDWPDAEKVAILGRCAEAVPSSGRVLVAGGVRAAGPPGPICIDKLLTGGNDTPLALFRGLVRQAGIEVVTTHEPSAGHLVS